MLISSRYSTAEVKSSVADKYSDKLSDVDNRPRATEKNPAFDEIDRKIIRALVADARLSFRDLGERIHLSPNATAERVRRLQEIKVISGFHAKVDRARLGAPLDAYIDIRLRSETSASSFEISAVKISGVMTFAVVTGEFDCRVRVACRDQADLMRLVEELRSGGAIQGTSTTVICREVEVRSTV
jgi:Lrp/AsnC family transcriptional regulator, leucine-responsive regulatory protein